MKIIKIIILSFLFTSLTFSQEQVEQNHDELWDFYPFTIDLSAGVWTPLEKFSEYYNPSIQFGVGFGLIISRKMRLQMWLMPKFFDPKKSLLLNLNDTVREYKEKSLGASVGGWLSYTFYQDKNASMEILTGITKEDIPTTIMKPNNNDSISISGLGLSIGVNSWINTFAKLNFGLRAIYTYSTYDNSKYLASSIGGHSITFSLVYRFPRR